MKKSDFDLFVIGGGSGGVRAARMAAQRGARVALAEVADLGGTCVNVGCIPKKLYSYAAHYGEGFAESAGFGWEIKPPVFNWNRLKANRAREIGRLNGVYQQLLEGAGVTLLRGWARVTGAHGVRVDDQDFSAEHILVATGGTPFVPDVPGREHVVTSDQMFDLEPFPSRLVVVGGGYIACEAASIFNGLGAEVTLVQRGARLLNGFDDDISTFVASEMGKAGVDVRLNAGVANIAARRSKTSPLLVTLSGGAQIKADAVLYATGRKPNTQGFGLEEAGVKLDERGMVVVDKDFRSSVRSIHALGDVSTHKALTPVALAEGMVLVDRLFGPAKGKRERQMDYDFIPTAVFTHPNVGTVGFTEAQARERFGKVTIYRSEFRALRHTLSDSTERTLMKLIVDDATDRVVGLHMVGDEAGEIVQGFAVALKAGATKATFDATIGIHPTAAEEFVTMREPSRD
ncbi:glutathione-disulfide reductase [Variovorax sp. VNK109]|jgi:glutathione reductase (NADPH)|uniref:glutathione-disulfide reductase n=1 Tax=Variovorax sp. VNK109 TaxID=3400919 RepID=UPI003C042D81